MIKFLYLSGINIAYIKKNIKYTYNILGRIIISISYFEGNKMLIKFSEDKKIKIVLIKIKEINFVKNILEMKIKVKK